MSGVDRVIRAGSAIAVAVSAHTVLNAMLLRRPVTGDGDGVSGGLFGPAAEERVSVCIPMRNEAANIGACLRAVLTSTGVANLEVLVLDDGSTDASVAGAEEAIAEKTPGIEAQVISGGGADVPDGWLGKPWACERLRREASGSVLVFLDADVRVAPNAVAVSTHMIRRLGWDLLSPYPRQIAASGIERLVQPLLQWLWLSFLPLRLAERTRPVSMAAANGQFMVIDAAALASVGGFAAVRGDVLDDVGLMRSFKRSGRRGGVVDGTTLAACRMYTDGSSLTDGYTKNLWAATGSVPGAVGLGGLLGLAYLVPPLGLLGRGTRRAGAAGYLAGVVGRVISAQTTGGRVADSFAHPLSIAMLLRLIARSWSAKRRGEISWKGRNLG